MSRVTVDVNACKKDGACIEVCPAQALSLNEEGFPEQLYGDNCNSCGQCVAVCPTGALSNSNVADALEPTPKTLPTPELVDNLLKSRRSIRAFKDHPVDRNVLLSVLDIARRAPTANNSQKLLWLVMNDKEKVRALAREAINGTDPATVQPIWLERWAHGYDFVLRGAPAVVVVCAPTEYGWGVEDAATALVYFEMAAKARGLGTCWAGVLTRVAAAHAPVRRLLNVPGGYSVRGGVMVGEAKYSYKNIPPRKALSMQWC